MRLSRHEQDDFRVEITTNPEVDAWEASFDNGDTWATGQLDDARLNTWLWLVAGPRVPVPDPTASVVRRRCTPLIRATKNHAVIVRQTPDIILY